MGAVWARSPKGCKLGSFIFASLILPSLWSFIFLGIFGIAPVRISRMAEAAGLHTSDAAHTYCFLSRPTCCSYSRRVAEQAWPTKGHAEVLRPESHRNVV